MLQKALYLDTGWYAMCTLRRIKRRLFSSTIRPFLMMACWMNPLVIQKSKLLKLPLICGTGGRKNECGGRKNFDASFLSFCR